MPAGLGVKIMAEGNSQTTTTDESSGGQQQSKSYEQLVREVTERVWQLLREDLRRERERRGKTGRRT